MAEQKFYIGSHGPYFYDDADDIDDIDGDFSGDTRESLSTTGQIKVETTPTLSNHLMRKSDVETLFSAAEILTKLLTVDGSGSGLDADLLDGQEGSYYLPSGASGTFTTTDSKTVTVVNGLITSIV